uniref:DNA-directed RNA polymerase subunit alpha n=1 Tax=Lobosphaera incisa TaxID=312850 RepID=A0A097KM38_9CHLO|nr:alpha subunit of RNA polymerase [Lobosphaera incisa]AIT94261.1 alpha subunit of RNA polymerase [Lobosphaera incisa]
MEQPLLSCIESKVENNRSFYGRFQLGPFDLGQGETIANALRRSLLSELSGLAITAVEIEGVTHEYSTLLGVRETVLDLLLNFKQIILTTEKLNSLEQQNPVQSPDCFAPQIGFLQVHGPGIVRAGDLKLPSFIQCVDPDQYLATLSYDSLLNVRFTISQGKNYIIQTPSGLKTPGNVKWSGLNSVQANTKFKIENFERPDILKNKSFFKSSETRNSFYLKKSEIVKNQEFLKTDKKLKKLVLTNPFFKKNGFLNTKEIYRPFSKLKNEVLNKTLPSQIFMSSTLLNDDNFQIDTNNETFPWISEVRYNNTLFQKSKAKISPFLLDSLEILKKTLPTNSEDFFGKNEEIETKQFNFPQKIEKTNNFSENKNFDSLTDTGLNFELKNKKQKISSNILPVDAVFMPVNKVNFLLEIDNDSEQPRNRIILEIWTNGSIHPRQALYNAAESMVQLFSFFIEKKTPLFDNISNTYTSNLNREDSFTKSANFNISGYNNRLSSNTSLFTNSSIPAPKLKKTFIGLKPAFQSIQPLFSNHLIKSLSKKAINRLLMSFVVKPPLTKSLNEILLFQTSSRFNIYNQTKNKLSFIQKKNLNLSSKFSTEKNKTSLDIGNLDLSLRPYTCLKRANIDTVADLLKFSRDELLLLKNFGKRSLDEVENNLQKIGLQLRN